MKTNYISIENLLNNSRKVDLRVSNLKGNKILINGNVINNLGTAIKNPLYLNNGKIVEKDLFLRGISTFEDVDIIDLKGNFLTPALIDQHVHGSFGVDFNGSEETDIRSLLRKMKEWGYSKILATFVPDTIERLNSQIKLLQNIMNRREANETEIVGINLEGPFFSKKRSGIHDPALLLKPTLENINKLDLDAVKLITIAPENDANYETIKYLNDRNIITSAGHSDANAQQVRDSGVKCITHLFNAMRPFHHRIPTIVNEGLRNNDIYVEVNTALELIAPDTINLIQQVKPDDKIILISDALRGLKDGETSFVLGTKEIFVDEKGIAKDDIGTLAGSLMLLGQVAKTIVDKTNITFEKFIKYTTLNPARLLGINDDLYIKEGQKPDMTIWDKSSLKPIKTFIKGE